MEIDNKKLEQTINKLDATLATLGRIDIWLPEAIDNAIHGHSGTLDRVDVDKIIKDKREEERYDAEMNSLHSQVEDSQQQTYEMARQTRYVMWGLVVTAVSSVLGLVLQIFQTFFK